jgi:hypothetical protein
MSARTRFLALLAGALILAGCGSSSSSSSPSTSSSSAAATSSATTSTGASASAAQIGFEGVAIEQGPLLAPAGTTETGTVHGIECGSSEQLAYHIHAHLAVYANGAPRTLPGGIGIPGSQVVQTAQGPEAAGGQCIYWLHTHAPDGVIHIESPTKRIYTLGDFFAEWHQPLSATHVADAPGKVTAVVNGKPWTKSPAAIPLEPHTVIQLSVGSPTVPFKSIDWSQTQL